MQNFTMQNVLHENYFFLQKIESTKITFSIQKFTIFFFIFILI